MISPAQPEGQVPQGTPGSLAAGYQAIPVERGTERQGARSRDDRFIEVKESGNGRTACLDGSAHDPAA
jgi:hypothetical protein